MVELQHLQLVAEGMGAMELGLGAAAAAAAQLTEAGMAEMVAMAQAALLW